MTAAPAIQPLSRAKRTVLRDLSTRHGRDRHGRFLLEGPRAIADALERDVRFHWLVVSEAGEEHALAWAEGGRLGAGVELYRTSDAELAELADTSTPQGVLAVGPIPPHALDDLPADPGPLVLLADGVQDPGNLGTLLRTLAAVGGRTALCARGTVDPFNPKALRGAAGATFALTLAVGAAPEAAAAWCADRGLALIALVTGAPSLFGTELPAGPVALAVGNEAAGLSDTVAARAAVTVALPMEPAVESLSVAVAGSVAMYALAHRLRAAEGG